MRLHQDKEVFHELSLLTAQYFNMPVAAIKRDYYIVMMLQQLANSRFGDTCVFKGGTSLSKCYNNSIKRLSEDIDLTYIPKDTFSNRQYNKSLKAIEKLMSEGGFLEIIPEERNDRNKSSYVWFDDYAKNETKVKLEIGSSVRPDPYHARETKTYIQEYLENHGMINVVKEYELTAISINTLDIERTFVDKVMSVKRHAICGTLLKKVRHIYDVTVLFERSDIQTFLSNKDQLKDIVRKTKDTDSYYLNKRNTPEKYNPRDPYNFSLWESCFDENIRNRYESLHDDLLFTTEKQDFDLAIRTFRAISSILSEIDE